MSSKCKEKTIYLATYTFCLIFVPIILNGIIYHRITILTEWWFYLPMFLIGVAGCFFRKEIRRSILLFQMPSTIHGFFMGTLFRIFSDDSYYIVLTSMIYGLFLILWQTFNRSSSIWQSLGILYLGILFLFAYPSIWWGDNWDTFIFYTSGSFSTYIVYVIGLLLTAIFYQVQHKVLKGFILCALCLYSFMGGFFFGPAIYNKCQYGTFTGRMHHPISSSMPLRPHTGKKTDLKELLHGYNACLFLTHTDILTIKQFEGLARMFNDTPIRFSILCIVPSEDAATILGQELKTMHVQLPWYYARKEMLQEECLTFPIYNKYIAIFKNDTLIYKGEASPTDGAARFLAKELQPDREEEKHAAPQ